MTSRALLRALIGALLLAALVLVGGPASAHAELVSTDPPGGSVLGRSPTSVRLRFTESVTTPTGAVTVLGPDGTALVLGRVETRGALVEVELPAGLGPGSYLVVWRVVSDDSHPIAGSFTFAVGARTPVPSAAAPATSRSVSVALGVLRWLGFAGCALAVGGLAFVAWCWPAGAGVRRVGALLVTGVGMLAASAVLSLLTKGPYDAGLGWGDTGRGELLRDVLATTYGRATLTRVLLALLLGLVVLARRRLSAGDLGLAGGVLGVATAVSFALAGHAAAGERRAAAIVSETGHVLAMSIWLGGLLLLTVGGAAEAPDARATVARFSRVAFGCLAVLLATGAFQAWRQVGSVTALAGTEYGHLLAVKLALVVMTVGVAAGTRRLVRRRGPTASVRRSIAIEVVLVLAVLALTAGLVATEPARTALGR